jgi:hypothetical protein
MPKAAAQVAVVRAEWSFALRWAKSKKVATAFFDSGK